QGVARARTDGAAASERLEDGAMGRADQLATVVGVELVGPEVERRADVGAAIDPRAELAAVVHQEAVDAAATALEAERQRAAGGEIGGMAPPLGGVGHAPHV